MLCNRLAPGNLPKIRYTITTHSPRVNRALRGLPARQMSGPSAPEKLAISIKYICRLALPAASEDKRRDYPWKRLAYMTRLTSFRVNPRFHATDVG